MRILFTGASSFTGYGFVQELHRAGHEVVAAFSLPEGDYQGLRGERVGLVLKCCKAVFSAPFGSSLFFDLIASQPDWDVLCHHASEVRHYKSPDFDYVAALAANTRQAGKVLEALKIKGCRRVVLTGTVFEPGEGAGTDGLRAVSPYGLSKGLTDQVFRYYCQVSGVALCKFVIPNPFGPYEELRFPAYLVQSWLEGSTPTVRFPEYVRDNVPTTLLAKAYCRFIDQGAVEASLVRASPSFYVLSQKEFALKIGREIGSRLHIPSPIEILPQNAFPEPRVRINTEPLHPEEYDWNEIEFWDALADYFRAFFKYRERPISEEPRKSK